MHLFLWYDTPGVRANVFQVPAGYGLRIVCLNFLRPGWNVGTNGMERDYSWSFAPFQAVCVHFEFQATEQPTRIEITK